MSVEVKVENVVHATERSMSNCHMYNVPNTALASLKDSEDSKTKEIRRGNNNEKKTSIYGIQTKANRGPN